MQALILAGGFGTRLQSVVWDRPKPMADVNGIPFLEHLVLEMKKQGIFDFIFAVGYLGNQIEEYFQNGEKWGISIQYSYEKTPLGTAGAIKNALCWIKEEELLVLNGDTFYEVNYASLYKKMQEQKADMVLLLRGVEDISRYGSVRIGKEGEILAFNEKITSDLERNVEKEDKILKKENRNPKSGQINGGIYLMKTSLVREIFEGKVSLENEMIPKWLEEKKKLYGIECDGYFIDIGIPEDYYRFCRDKKESGILFAERR